jgi:hypothetical protein
MKKHKPKPFQRRLVRGMEPESAAPTDGGMGRICVADDAAATDEEVIAVFKANREKD